jgi:hypothetical protein
MIDKMLKRREEGIKENDYKKVFTAELALTLPDLWNKVIDTQVYKDFDNDDEKFYYTVAYDCLMVREYMFQSKFYGDGKVKEIELMRITIIAIIKNICEKGKIEFKGFRKKILFFPELEGDKNGLN